MTGRSTGLAPCRSTSTRARLISPNVFVAFLAAKREAAEDVEQAVRAIIADVIARGDRALIALTQKFDRVDLDAAALRVGRDEIEAAAGRNASARRSMR